MILSQKTFRVFFFALSSQVVELFHGLLKTTYIYNIKHLLTFNISTQTNMAPMDLATLLLFSLFAFSSKYIMIHDRNAMFHTCVAFGLQESKQE